MAVSTDFQYRRRTALPEADIALITEGTYPAHHGGVSVWCDQLIRGLPERSFRVYAIAGVGREPSIWAAPKNLINVTQIPTWGSSPAAGTWRGRRETSAFAATHEGLLDALFSNDTDGFSAALQSLHAYSETANLGAALVSESALRRLHVRWLESPLFGGRFADPSTRPSLGDALASAELLEHFLRPLAATPAPAAVYHSSSNGLASLVAMAGKWSHGAPFVLTEHGVYLRERYLSFGRKAYTHPVRTLVLAFFRLLSAASYQHADLIAPVSHFNRRWQEQNGANPHAIEAVHNGLDPAAFPHVGPEPKVPTISWVGRVDPLKDVETLIRSFALVRGELPEARLRMFGSTPPGCEAYRDRCKALIEELGLSKVAVFEGHVSAVSEAYRAGSIIALSSVSEGFPYTVIEGMMSGRASVSTDVGGVAEAVGRSGMVVPPKDPRAFADACLTLFRDDVLRARMAKSARRRALRLFTLNRFLGNYRSIYDRVASPGEPATIHHIETTPVKLHLPLVQTA